MDKATEQQNNKRIAKNTLLLYFRMFFIMAATLYTSRILLKQLGVTDYGIYNVVGSVVAMVGLISGAMSTSTQRFFSFELGKKTANQLNKVFNISIYIYALIGIVILILAETVGIWFLKKHLIIPESRISAAFWCYQFSVLSFIFSLAASPFNAMIIAHEKMNIYAYVSVLEAVLKLAIVFVLSISDMDNLILYGFLYMVMSFIVSITYAIYCKKKYIECRFLLYKDLPMMKEMLSYSGWNLFGAVSTLVKGQGLNVLLNMFFNPVVNAARGIAYQINATITQFFQNFYTAFRPQIIKYYAHGENEKMFNLVFSSSRCSFYLMLIVSLPIILETPFIINMWLGQVPEYVVSFTRIIIAISTVDAMASPIMTAAQATGKIRLYQVIVGSLTIANLPISYALLSLGYSPISVFNVSLVISVTNMFVRLFILKRLIVFSIFSYLTKVLGVCVLVGCGAFISSYVIGEFLGNSIIDSFLKCCITVLLSIFSVILLGLNKNERATLISFIKRKIRT